MQTFMEFRSGQAYTYTSMVREWIYGGSSLMFVENFFDASKSEMLDKALAPQKEDVTPRLH